MLFVISSISSKFPYPFVSYHPMPVPLPTEVCPQSAAGAFLVPELHSMKGPRKSLSLMPLDGRMSQLSSPNLNLRASATGRIWIRTIWNTSMLTRSISCLCNRHGYLVLAQIVPVFLQWIMPSGPALRWQCYARKFTSGSHQRQVRSCESWTDRISTPKFTSSRSCPWPSATEASHNILRFLLHGATF